MAKRSVSAALCTALALAGSAALTGCGSGSGAAGTTTTSTRPRTTTPANVVRIHWRKTSLVPATHAGRVCITTYKVGHFCVAYASGDTPADVLTQQLRQRGFKVQTIP